MTEPRREGMSGERPDVAIVGAGPAGLIAAEKLSEAGLAVTIYERMPSVGRKFLIAGRGGLNLTHSEPLERFLTRYGPAEPHLAAAIEAFPPAALRAWAEGLGQPTFVGSSGRVFPAALKASPLLRAWLARLARRGVAFRLRQEWRGWDYEGRLIFRDRDGALEKADADATLLTLGGASWPKLGSNGAWTDMLAARGVAIAPLRPANCGFEIAWTEHFRDRFAGQPLKNVALSFAGQKIRGEAVVTRYGIEGGAVYALSAALRDAILRDGKAVPSLDLRPDFSPAALTKRLASGPARQSLANRLRKAGLSPLAANLLREAAGPDMPRDPAALAGLAKALPLTLVAPQSLERAISTAGGVSFSALDETFMLRALPGVFAAGEMLDWEAPTGGYLLQASFATGVAAARGMLARLQAGSTWRHLRPRFSSMSRAFVKEPDGADDFDALPDRPISPHANLVTARGLALLDAAVARSRAALGEAQQRGDRAAIAAASRDFRYFNARRASAELVPQTQESSTVRFGSRVTIERGDGRTQTFRIVGEDEADPAEGLLSYVSPLARALTGKRVGDVVPAGQSEAEILAIEAVSDDSD